MRVIHAGARALSPRPRRACLPINKRLEEHHAAQDCDKPQERRHREAALQRADIPTPAYPTERSWPTLGTPTCRRSSLRCPQNETACRRRRRRPVTCHRPAASAASGPADDVEWEPLQSFRAHTLRIKDTACCGAYELAAQGGQYIVLRPRRAGGYEETGRDNYQTTIAVWNLLVAEHGKQHRHQAAREPGSTRGSPDAESA
jgi:hypothetical protein